MEIKNKAYLITLQSGSGNELKITQHGQGIFDACRNAMEDVCKRRYGSNDWEIVEVKFFYKLYY